MSDKCEFNPLEESDQITPPRKCADDNPCELCRAHQAVITELVMTVNAIKAAVDECGGVTLVDDRTDLQKTIKRLEEENLWLKRVIQALTPA